MSSLAPLQLRCLAGPMSSVSQLKCGTEALIPGPRRVAPAPSPCTAGSPDLEGQTSTFTSVDGQVTIVQDVYGLFIEHTSHDAGLCPPWRLWRRKPVGSSVQYVPYCEIVSVRYLPVRRYRSSLPAHLRKQHFVEVQTVQRRPGQPWHWSLKRLELSAESPEVAKLWVQQVKQRLQQQTQRPSKLLVFVNPFGGKRKALKVWDTVAAPVLAAAGVQCEVIETLHQGHAQGVMESLSLQQLQRLDGVVAVGGDGLFSELLTGTLKHQHLEAALQLRLAHIPAGSTDAVACTLHGTRDPLTATLHIVLGDCTPLDVARMVTMPAMQPQHAAVAAKTPFVAPAAVSGVCGMSAGSDTLLLEPLGHRCSASTAESEASTEQQANLVYTLKNSRHERRYRQQQEQQSRHKGEQQQEPQQPQLRHFVCVANYGFLGDVMQLSEKLRWMGPIRYDIAGAVRWLLLRGYKATVWFKPAQLQQQQQQQQQGESPPTQQQQQQTSQPVPMVGPSAVSQYLHHPQPALHAAYQHQHYHEAGSGRADCSSVEDSISSSCDVQESQVWSTSGRTTPESAGAEGSVNPSLHADQSVGHNQQKHASSPASESSRTTNSGNGARGATCNREVDTNGIHAAVYAEAESVSSLASNPAAAAGLVTRTSSATSSSSRCYSRCLVCGAAAMRRANSRSAFIKDSQAATAAGVEDQLSAAAALDSSPVASNTASAGSRSTRDLAPSAACNAEPEKVGIEAGTTAAAHEQTGYPAACDISACSPPVASQPEGKIPPGSDWVKVDGNFTSIMCVVTSCRSDKSKEGLMPEAHLSDGRIALVLVDKCSRMQYLRFLVQLTSRGILLDMLPFVRIVYVTDVVVQAEGKQSIWNVDGELLKHNRVGFGVHAGLVDVFARGVEVM